MCNSYSFTILKRELRLEPITLPDFPRMITQYLVDGLELYASYILSEMFELRGDIDITETAYILANEAFQDLYWNYSELYAEGTMGELYEYFQVNGGQEYFEEMFAFLIAFIYATAVVPTYKYIIHSFGMYVTVGSHFRIDEHETRVKLNIEYLTSPSELYDRKTLLFEH